MVRCSRKIQLLTAIALAPVSLLALISAQAQSFNTQDFPDTEKIIIDDFIGTLTIRIADGPVRVEVAGKPEGHSFSTNADDNILRLVGDENVVLKNYFNSRKWWNWDTDQFPEFLKDYADVTLTIPAGTDLTVAGSIVDLQADDGLGNVEIGKGHIEANFGDVASAEINMTSRFDVEVGKVAQTLKVHLKGSSDFKADDFLSGAVNLAGSGNISVGAAADDLDIVLSGSGDIDTGDIGGATEILLSGSGDIETGIIGEVSRILLAGSGDIKTAATNGDLEVNLSGSGDVHVNGGVKAASLVLSGSGTIRVAEVNGKTKASILGSGDIDIDDGLAENLRVAVRGNGDFHHGGKATNLDVAIRGHGDVYVKSNEGSLTTSGRRGTVRVNGKKIDLDDDYR